MPRSSYIALACFCAATVLLVPLGWYIAGFALWFISAVLTYRQRDSRVRRNLGILLGCVAVLAFAPIDTGLDTRHMAILASCFALVVLAPSIIMGIVAPGELVWHFWPRRLSKRELTYTLISIPLSWFVINMYFFHLNPDLASHWMLPASYNTHAVRRLVVGVNCVGIWDELFFVNTVYGLLRGVFPPRVANAAQAVVYTSVLYDMAFTGHGIWIVYLFALTQGVMFERSRVLLWVLIVHLVVDLWLVLAILQWHFPGHSPGIF
jgi:membrane protease YdiL (CAAX protease family)